MLIGVYKLSNHTRITVAIESEQRNTSSMDVKGPLDDIKKLGDILVRRTSEKGIISAKKNPFARFLNDGFCAVRKSVTSNVKRIFID